MRTTDTEYLASERTGVPRDVVRKVLRAVAVILAAELQANESVPIPHLGTLVPMEKPVRSNKRPRVVTFEPNTALKKKLANPTRRLRVVGAD